MSEDLCINYTNLEENDKKKREKKGKEKMFLYQNCNGIT